MRLFQKKHLKKAWQLLEKHESYRKSNPEDFEGEKSELFCKGKVNLLISTRLSMHFTCWRQNCSKVRTKEGSGHGWLVETRVILLLFSINLNRCALCASSVHQLSRLSQGSLSAFVLAVSLVTDHAPESPLRLSLNSRSTVAFIRFPRQLLQSDTGVPHFALDPLTYRCLLSLSPAADFAEPRPPRHKN